MNCLWILQLQAYVMQLNFLLLQCTKPHIFKAFKLFTVRADLIAIFFAATPLHCISKEHLVDFSPNLQEEALHFYMVFVESLNS